MTNDLFLTLLIINLLRRESPSCVRDFFLPNWKWLFLGCRQFLLLVGLRRGDEKTITNVSDIINGESKKYFQGFYSWGRVFNEANFKCFPQKWRELWQLSENRFELQVSRAWLCPFFALYFLIFMLLLLPLQPRVSRCWIASKFTRQVEMLRLEAYRICASGLYCRGLAETFRDLSPVW